MKKSKYHFFSCVFKFKRSFLKRQELFRELLETEKEYVESLKQIVDVWLIPLREAAESKTERILEKEDILKIFSNSEILYHVHKELCIEIQTCADLTSVVKIFNKRVIQF